MIKAKCNAGVDKKRTYSYPFYSRGCKMDEEELGGKKFSI